MPSSPQPEPPYSIPAFDADEAVRARYAALVRELTNSAIARALTEVRDQYEAVRMQLIAAWQVAQVAQQAAESAAHQARARYAKIVPKERTASGRLYPPTLFFDNLVSIGAAGTYYKEATRAEAARQAAVEVAQAAYSQLEQHKGKASAAQVVRELEVRRYYKTDEGRLELEHADPQLGQLAAQCQAIDAERAEFAARLEAGTVSDAELRDRTMAQDGWRWLDGDLRGVYHVPERDQSFGQLHYLALRDREGRTFLVDYHNDLRILKQVTFDVIYANERYLISRSSGAPAFRTGDVTPAASEPDPRALLGVDPRLMRALRDFAARERITI